MEKRSIQVRSVANVGTYGHVPVRGRAFWTFLELPWVTSFERLQASSGRSVRIDEELLALGHLVAQLGA